MDLTEGLKIFEYYGRNAGLHNTLGMEFISTPDADSFIARMPVDDRHIQPFGYLNGGASLALAETAAGLGSYSLCPDKITLGMSVNCNHLHTVPSGTTLTAVVRIVHRGKRTHLWRVEINDESGKTASIITVSNFISENNDRGMSR